MTRWSWVIDQTKCIGCHACTTACKSENDVAVGVFRTWVKHVDVGVFPQTKRHFAVLRCNHCEDAPCVAICPVTAMYQRDDGLVDFDESRCIGCKACMQACPYDAIYMDPDSNTAHKCNFCSHRVDQGLLPACVVVCPVEALIFGDLDNEGSQVAREVKANKVSVRRPEQRTRPKAFYIGAHEATLDPLGAVHEEMYMWADNPGAVGRNGGKAVTSKAGAIPPDRPTALPPRVSYDIPRQRTWGWKVSSYIWTKSIAAGAAIIPAFFALAGDPISGDELLGTIAPIIALAALVVTGILLVADLKRPERFWTILFRPQWRSWLAKGAFVITAYGALLTGWAWSIRAGADQYVRWLSAPLIVLALLTAVYTAWLFAQCEGRDLWQSRLLKFHLLIHAPVTGALALILTASLRQGHEHLVSWGELAAGGLLLGALLAVADAFMKHDTANAAAAAWQLARGRQASLFWTSLIAGALLPAVLLIAGPLSLYPVAAALGLAGVWLYGHALVLAGQGPPIS